jgi:hypothetical protein
MIDSADSVRLEPDSEKNIRSPELTIPDEIAVIAIEVSPGATKLDILDLDPVKLKKFLLISVVLLLALETLSAPLITLIGFPAEVVILTFLLGPIEDIPNLL